MKRMEVRCCCVPNKLLGTVPVPEILIRDGGRVTLPLMGNLSAGLTRSSIEFEVQRWSKSSIAPLSQLPGNGLEEPVIVRESGIALKHENVTLDTLRRIPGFIEAGLSPLSSLATKELK